LKIAIAGALGRMGQAVEAIAGAQPELVIAARFDRPGAEGGGLVTQAQALAAADVVIDFTTPEASVALAKVAATAGRPALVIGATGLQAEHLAAIRAAAILVPIVQTGNFSLGVNILAGLVRQAAKLLPSEAYDIEIFEAHHRHKVDSPSGTALMLGRAAAAGRGVDLDEVSVRGRDGITGARRAGDIGFSVMRGGGIVGAHSVSFAAEEEILTLSHAGIDRALFARGAVAAARWLAGKPPGLYDMQDVLGFAKEG
jgi:4-hydroxy-tetrahydrodipicolinate reductase